MRERRALTTTEVGAAVGVHAATVARWEGRPASRAHAPRASVLPRLRDLYGAGTVDVFFGPDDVGDEDTGDSPTHGPAAPPSTPGATVQPC